jgi:hypothetical protein
MMINTATPTEKPRGVCTRHHGLSPISWFALILTFFLAGCQSQPTFQGYPGPAKPANEEGRVFIAKAFNLLNVDGDSYNQPLLGNNTLVKLLPGSHKIVIKYVDYWSVGPDTDERVASQPILVAFTAKAGENYLISAPELIDAKAAMAYAKNPQVDIINKNTKTSVATDIQYQLKDKGLVAAFVDSLSPDPTPASAPESPNSDISDQAEPALDMLKYWWQKANTQQQDDFMQWTKENN